MTLFPPARLGLVAFFLLVGAQSGLRAVEGEDFESLSPELPGWSATTNPGEYRPAARWDTPIAISVDASRPHGGANSLRMDVLEPVDGMVSIGPPTIPVTGPEITIRFFVRSEGLSGEGLMAFDESEQDGKRLKAHWAAAKIPQSDDWTEVTWTGPIEASSPAVRVRFVFKNPPAGAKVWIDDFQVTSGK